MRLGASPARRRVEKGCERSAARAMCSATSETTALRWQLTSSSRPWVGCSSKDAAERRPWHASASTGRPSEASRRRAAAARTAAEATRAAT
eukprot:555341-Prymnesium_polylepis.1